ncbi:MAG: radical SAM/SPASM domain-containing protein [Anaerolineales bacterium]
MPINITLSPSPRCNSRCLTCNIWMKRELELSLEEWDKTLSSLGKSPYWFTVSGGEPFLYGGIDELCGMIYKHCRPGIINIPTNAILQSIPAKVEKIARVCSESRIIINLSLDAIGNKHDEIRGVPGNFDKFEATLKELLRLKQLCTNLTIGIHSVISTFNTDQIPALLSYFDASNADQFVSEIAEQRIELDTVGLPITPDAAAYAHAVDLIADYLEKKDLAGVARFTKAFRLEYYQLVKRILEERRQVIDCYAGWASAQIYADGTVWPCCIRADNLGNLRDVEYDFKQIWFGEPINAVRRSIASGECYCPLANASYTNMLHHIPTIARVSSSLIWSSNRREKSLKPEEALNK